MIELGGNIKLENFENLDPIKLVVVKKVVGNYAKKISEKHPFQELKLVLTADNEFKVDSILTKENKETRASSSDKNLFYALNQALDNLTKAL